MLSARIDAVGVNSPEVANKFLVWFERAFRWESKQAIARRWDNRHWKVARGWHQGDLAKKMEEERRRNEKQI